MILFFSVVLIINFILYVFSSKIAKVLNIYDNPDKIRKFHKTKTPITGGIIVLLNVIIFYLYNGLNISWYVYKSLVGIVLNLIANL